MLLKVAKVKRRVSALSKDTYQRAVEVLIEARTGKGMTQRDLAEGLDVPQSYVSKIESRERRVDIAELIMICRALGVSPASIIRKIAADI